MKLQDSALFGALSDVIGDLADLVQMEIRLAKTELSTKLSQKLVGGIWLGVAGVIGLLAVLVLVEAAIFAIASYGVGLHWSCLIIAGALAILGGAAFAKGRADAQVELPPTHSLHQIQRDIAVAKEHLS
ncbi:MAG TPA: phage holin family protein [Xanthobacteraceae bacterium]|jgi:hypothetical protein|nr:phage holin family protein [Xanthobacteraceae bacterium]